MSKDMPPIRIFWSYAHTDEKHRDGLGAHFATMRRLGLVVDWHDRKILVGEEWDQRIAEELAGADLILLLVSAAFLNSNYCWGVEVAEAMRRHAEGTAKVVPIMVDDCDTAGLPFQDLQGAPHNFRPITKWRPYSSAYTDVAKKVRKAVEDIRAERAATATETSAPPAKEDIGRLPRASGALFGRDDDFEWLEKAWRDQGGVATLVADGGTGKSALVWRWLVNLKNRRWDGAAKVFGWSFYSQGTDRQASADDFLDAALTFFEYPGEHPKSAWDKGVALAELMRAERCLLILDGMEPLQYGKSDAEELRGRLKDQGLQGLLRTLARKGNPGLCLVTTRLAVADLARWEEAGRAHRHALGALSPQSGADLLASFGVTGELENIARDFGGHPLALALLGCWLRDRWKGDGAKAKGLRPHDPKAGPDDHCFRVLEAIAETLSPAHHAVLGMVGLFDRPVVSPLIAALRADPPIPGLTDALAGVTEGDWTGLLDTLRHARLLLPEDHQGVLDAHPLVREFFGERLKTVRPDAWTAAHSRIFDTLCALAPDLPNTLEEMGPLFQAVRHGCEAGRQQEALDEVLVRRVGREGAHFAPKRLGAYGALLSALGALFKRPWDIPSPALAASAQAYVLSSAGFSLRAVGRLAEAVPPMEAALMAAENAAHAEHAASRSGNLAETLLTLGRVAEAEAMARRAVEHARMHGGWEQPAFRQATLADALFQNGQITESCFLFAEAERLQSDDHPFGFLYSLRGYQYCDLLLDLGEWQQVRVRAEQTREWVKPEGWLLDIALDTLSLGRAAVLAARSGAGDWKEAAALLDEAVSGLRGAGQIQFLPLGLLARADLCIERGYFDGADEDLDEAREIAESGSMGLYLADCLLAEARLAVARNDLAKARPLVAEARRRIYAMGYHRRDREVEDLEKRLAAV